MRILASFLVLSFAVAACGGEATAAYEAVVVVSGEVATDDMARQTVVDELKTLAGAIAVEGLTDATSSVAAQRNQVSADAADFVAVVQRPILTVTLTSSSDTKSFTESALLVRGVVSVEVLLRYQPGI